jgi:hypothetical protein
MATVPVLSPRLPKARLLGLVGAGAAVYDRARMLPRLLPVGPDELEGPEPATGQKLCAMLSRALRAERRRGRAGHWTYDLNRHIGLVQAFRAERAALAGRRTERRPAIAIAPDPV